jgi:heterodisulfide reductase subunit A
VVRQNGKLVVSGSDTLSAQPMQIEADLVVLATAMVPAAGSLASTLRIATDANGFFQEAHPKLRPVETLTAGIFITGAAHAPKDIPDTVAQASASAAKSLELLTRTALEREPMIARVDEALCMACFECVQVCPYHATERVAIKDREGRVIRMVARVNPALCEGCGSCVAGCRVGALDLAGFTDMQIFQQLGALAVTEPAW